MLIGSMASATGRSRQSAAGRRQRRLGRRLVITSANDRRLRFSAQRTGCKNGDRWNVAGVGHDGALTVAEPARRTVRLPAEYVAESVELGYACTVHTAQGVTATRCTAWPPAAESRQQLYTMMTRGGTPTTSTSRSSATATRTA